MKQKTFRLCQCGCIEDAHFPSKCMRCGKCMGFQPTMSWIPLMNIQEFIDRLSLILALLAIVALPIRAQMSVSISAVEPAPFPLAGVVLYSAQTCSAAAETRQRAISAGQYKVIALGAGIGFQDPVQDIPIEAKAAARSSTAILLDVANLLTKAGTMTGVAETGLKAQYPGAANTRAWAIGTVAVAALSAAVPAWQASLQAKAAAAATVTSGVQAALIKNLDETYTVPPSGLCSASKMFFGTGNTKTVGALIP